jgi:hypothetical protein
MAINCPRTDEIDADNGNLIIEITDRSHRK